jgi:hypothetical protein
MWGTLSSSLTRGRVCPLPESQSVVISLLSVCTIYILHVIECMYIQHIQGLCQSQSQSQYTADRAPCLTFPLLFYVSVATVIRYCGKNVYLAVVQQQTCIRWRSNTRNVQPLPSNDRLFWPHYSGFQASCQIYTVCLCVYCVYIYIYIYIYIYTHTIVHLLLNNIFKTHEWNFSII